MIERNGYAGFAAFPASPGTTGPIRPIDGLSQSVRVILTGAAFSVRVQISNAEAKNVPPHSFTPPDSSFETFITAVPADSPLSIPGPVRFVRLIVDSGQVEDARIEESQVDAWSVKLETTAVSAANAVDAINDGTSGLLALTLAQQAALVELNQVLVEARQAVADTEQLQTDLGATPVNTEADLAGKPADIYSVRATGERVTWNGTTVTGRVQAAPTVASVVTAQADATAAQLIASVAKSAVGNLMRSGLATKTQADGPQFADGSRWVWKASGTANDGATVAALGGGVWAREYAGPVFLSWFITGQNITTALQVALTVAKVRAVYGREVIIDPPTEWPYYIVTDSVVFPHGTGLRNSGSTVRPQTGTDAEGSMILFDPGTLSNKPLFTHAAAVGAPSYEGYVEPITLTNITAQLAVASRGGGASFFACTRSSKLKIIGGYIDRFDYPIKADHLIDTTFEDVTFRTFKTAISVIGVDTTTFRMYGCYFKGNSESDLVFDFGPDAMYDCEAFACTFESVKQIAKLKKGSSAEFFGCYAENVGYDSSSLGMFEVAKEGTSAKSTNNAGSLKIHGGTWAGKNGTVADDSTFIDAGDAHLIQVNGIELARFGRAVVTTANTVAVRWRDNTFIQMGTGSQPDMWRGIARWSRFQGEKTKNRILGGAPAEFVTSRHRIYTGSSSSSAYWDIYAENGATDSDLCFDFNGTRMLRLDNLGNIRPEKAIIPRLLTRAALLALSATVPGQMYQVSDPPAGKSFTVISYASQWRYSADQSLVT